MMLLARWVPDLEALFRLSPAWEQALEKAVQVSQDHHRFGWETGPASRMVLFRLAGVEFLAELGRAQIFLWRFTSCCGALQRWEHDSRFGGLSAGRCSGCLGVPDLISTAQWVPPMSPKYNFPQILEAWLGEGLGVLTAALVAAEALPRIERIFRSKVLCPALGQEMPPALAAILRAAEGPV